MYSREDKGLIYIQLTNWATVEKALGNIDKAKRILTVAEKYWLKLINKD